MQHTYFYETMDWKAQGTYYNEQGQEFALYGEVSVVRDSKEWTLGGFMEVQFECPTRFTNHYQIMLTKDPTTLEWSSYNPALGELKGTFEIVGDSIISHYTSKDGVYSGIETLVYQNDETYYNAGVAFCNNKKMSSWIAMLYGKRVNEKNR